jgi:hypothetical protein
VIEIPVLLFHIDILDAGAAGDDVFLRRLAHVAAVMEPVGALRHIGEEALLFLAGEWIKAAILAALIAVNVAGIPHEALGHDDVLQAAVAALFMRRGPHVFARFGVHALHRAIATGVDDHIVVHEDARGEIELIQAGGASWDRW